MMNNTKKYLLLYTGNDAEIERKKREVIAVKERLQKKTLLSLAMPEMQLAAEYFTPDEMVKFKKPKKKVFRIILPS